MHLISLQYYLQSVSNSFWADAALIWIQRSGMEFPELYFIERYNCNELCDARFIQLQFRENILFFFFSEISWRSHFTIGDSRGQGGSSNELVSLQFIEHFRAMYFSMYSVF